MPQSSEAPAGWPRHPLIYEINTWPWLAALSGAVAAPTSLDRVPDAEWDRIAGTGSTPSG